MGEISIKQALYSPENKQRFDTMPKEKAITIKNYTWTSVDRPVNHAVLGSRIVLRNKYNADGSIKKRKARLVAQGLKQKPGIHFNDISYSSMIMTLNILL